MNTQLEQNTNMSNLLLKDVVTSRDVADFLIEISTQFVENKKISNETTTNPYQEIQSKLRTDTPLNKKELDIVAEILSNANKLFTTYGKHTVGLNALWSLSVNSGKVLNNLYDSPPKAHAFIPGLTPGVLLMQK